MAALVRIFSWPLRDLRRARGVSPYEDDMGWCAHSATHKHRYADAVPKVAHVPPLGGIAPAASVAQLAHKPMPS